MRSRIKLWKERSIWLIPFSILTFVLIIAMVDLLLAYYFLDVSHQIWMWALSSLMTVVIASIVTEFISLNDKRAIASLILASVVTMVIYIDIAIFLHGKATTFIESIIPNPIFSNSLYAVTMTLIPGVTIGGIIGSITGLFTGNKRVQSEKEHQMALDQIGGYEKYCEECGYSYKSDSKFCPFCGKPLSTRPRPLFRFCRYCGCKMYGKGKYCPDCGREITVSLNTL